MIKRRFKLIKRGLDDGSTIALDDLSDVAVSSPNNGDVLFWNGSSWIPAGGAFDVIHSPGAAFGDGNDADSVADGLVGYVRVPYSGTIQAGHIVADTSITGSVAVWKAAGAVPTVADIISASDPIALVSATTGANTSLTGWTKTVSVGDVLAFDLTLTIGTPKQIVVTLSILEST
jgi:hypothetical protein